MKVQGLLIGSLLIFTACVESVEENVPVVDKVRTPEKVDSVRISVLDTLHFDWFQLKEELRFLNCGDRLNQEEGKLRTLLEGEFLYQYCAHNGNQKAEFRQVDRPLERKLFEVIVIKTAGEIGQYSDRNEELSFLHASISQDALGAINWVGRTKVEAIQVFGVPLKDTLDCLVYYSKQRALILKYDGNDRFSALNYYSRLRPEMEWHALLDVFG